MKYGAKAAWERRLLQEKIKRGADGIEIQLLTGNPEKEMLPDLGIDMYKQIKAIHIPLENGFDYSIDTIDGQNMLSKVCNIISNNKYLSENLNIICHYRGKKKIMERYGIYEQTINHMKNIAKKFPNYTFCIENTTVELLSWENDNITLVQDINEPNVGTCLDTCHIFIVEKATTLAGNIGNTKIVSAEDHFKANQNYCKHMHICDAIWVNGKYGVNKGHGMPFDDINDIERIVEYYRKYNFNTDIVYEVREDDYMNCTNYSLIKQQFNDRLI